MTFVREGNHINSSEKNENKTIEKQVSNSHENVRGYTVPLKVNSVEATSMMLTRSRVRPFMYECPSRLYGCPMAGPSQPGIDWSLNPALTGISVDRHCLRGRGRVSPFPPDYLGN